MKPVHQRKLQALVENHGQAQGKTQHEAPGSDSTAAMTSDEQAIMAEFAATTEAKLTR